MGAVSIGGKVVGVWVGGRSGAVAWVGAPRWTTASRRLGVQ